MGRGAITTHDGIYSNRYEYAVEKEGNDYVWVIDNRSQHTDASPEQMDLEVRISQMINWIQTP